MNCWRCHEPVQGPVCVGCGVIQPLRPDADLFALLGVERRWRLDNTSVDANWRAVSRKVHPDRFAGRRAVERRMSLQWTAAINEARRVLRDDRARAWYLSTGKAAAPEKDAPSPSPEFLEEVFELQMSARDEPDEVRERAEQLMKQAIADLDACFARAESGDGDVGAAARVLVRLGYLDNVLKLASGAH